MLAKLHTFALLGIDAVPVDVEVDVSLAVNCRGERPAWELLQP